MKGGICVIFGLRRMDATGGKPRKQVVSQSRFSARLVVFSARCVC